MAQRLARRAEEVMKELVTTIHTVMHLRVVVHRLLSVCATARYFDKIVHY